MTRQWLGGCAVFGTALAHVAAYWAATPDPHERAALLEATGHHRWDVVVALASGALMAAVAGFVWDRIRSVRRRSTSPAALFRYAGWRLGALQCVAFLLLESAECIHAGGAAVRPIALGLVMQVAVALAIAALLVVLARTVEVLTRARDLSPSRSTGSAAFAHTGIVGPRPRLVRGGRSLRGPPPGAGSTREPLPVPLSNGGCMRITRIAAIALAVVAAPVVLATPAWAHVTANPSEAPSEGFFTTFFRIGHGCDSDAPDTAQISIQIPDGVISATPEQVPGWNAETKTRKLEEPIESEGEEITEVVSEVTWTSEGEPLNAHQFREFGLSLQLAAEGQEALYFPTVQKCEQGSIRWVNIPSSLEEWHDTDDPAPYLQLTAAEGGHDEGQEGEEEETATGGMDPEEIAALAADQAVARIDDDGTEPVVYVALGAGVLGIVIGLAALLRRPKAE